MHELSQSFQTFDFYDPLILKLVGSAFINYSRNEEPITDEICLEYLGAFIINKLKNGKYTLPEDVTYDIAFAKRWDASEIVGQAIYSRDSRSAADYLNILEMKFKRIFDNQSLAQVMHSFLLHVLEYAPQTSINIDLIRESLKEKPLEDQIKILIDNFETLDHTQKEQALLQQFNEVANPSLICSLHLLKAVHKLKALYYTGIWRFINLRKQIPNPLKIEEFNLAFTESFIENCIDALCDNDFNDLIHNFAQRVNTYAIAAVRFLVIYCDNPSKLCSDERNQFIREINQNIHFFKYNSSILTNYSTLLHDLLTTLENDSLKGVSASVVTKLKPSLKKVDSINADFANYINGFEKIRSTIETVTTTLSDQDLTVINQNHLQSLYKFGQKTDQFIMTYCSDASKLSVSELNQFICEIDDRVNHIKNDISKVNDIYSAFNQLLLLIKQDEATEALVNQAFQKLNVFNAHCNNFMKRLEIIKSEVESLINALKLSESADYHQLQVKFIDFNKRFAEPPKQMQSLIHQLTQDFEQIQLSVNAISQLIKEKANEVNTENLRQGNYIEHHKAYSLLNAIRAHSHSLEEKSRSFNIAKDKCLSFESNFENFHDIISAYNDTSELEPLQNVFRLTLRTFQIEYSKVLKPLYQSDITQKVLILKEELKNLETKLSTLICTREQELPKYVSPIAHNKFKKREPESEGTPQHGQDLHRFFRANADETKRQCVRKNLFLSVNTPASPTVPVNGLT